MSTSTQMSKEDLGGQVMCDSIKTTVGSPGCGGRVRNWEHGKAMHNGEHKRLAMPMPGTGNTCLGKAQAASRGNTRKKPCGLWPARS